MRSNYDDRIPDGSKKESKINIGLIAQEVHAVEKSNGFGETNDDCLFVNQSEDGEQYGMSYDRLVPVLVNAVKELSAQNEALVARITALESN